MPQKIATRAADMQKTEKAVTNDDIARAVLRSQPPNPIDVSDIVDYNQKRGGGSSACHVNEILKFLQVENTPPKIRVSGKTFKALASLNFGATELLATAINAVLKRVACGDRLDDGVSAIYKSAEISSLVAKKKKKKKKKKKNDFLKANQIVENARVQLQKQGDTISAALHVQSESWLQMMLVDFVVNKPSRENRTFKTMTEISEKFLEKVLGKMDADKSQQDDRKTDASKADSSSSSFIVQYDAEGQAVDVPKMPILNKGYKLDSLYFKAKEKTDVKEGTTDRWKLIAIAGNEECIFVNVSQTGETTTVEIKVSATDLFAKSKSIQKKFKSLVGYLLSEGKYNKPLATEVWEGRVKDCVHTLALTIPDHQLRIQLNPTRGVFCPRRLRGWRPVLGTCL